MKKKQNPDLEKYLDGRGRRFVNYAQGAKLYKLPYWSFVRVAKEANSSTASTMKMMKIIMPIIMVIFTLSASASFGLYILASNVATMALGEVTTVIVNALTKKKRLEVEEELEKEANRLIKKGKFKE